MTFYEQIRELSSAGKEMPVRQPFTWGCKHLYVLSVYFCGEELVIDIGIVAEPEDLRAFIEKWDLQSSFSFDDFSGEDRLLIEREYPLHLNFNAAAALDGKTRSQQYSCCCFWIPAACFPDNRPNDPEMARVLKHYRLDPLKGWAIQRVSLPWTGGCQPACKTLSLHLSQSPDSFPGPHFIVQKPGQTVPFTHPVTGREHILTILQCEPSALQLPYLPNDEERENPSCYTILIYTISPDIPSDHFMVWDCEKGDGPRLKRSPGPSKVCSSPRPTVKTKELSEFLTSPSAIPHVAASALWFEPAEQVEWRMVFHEKTLEDITVEVPLDKNRLNL